MERLTAIVFFSLLFSITSVGQNSGDVQITHMPKYKSTDTAYSYRLYGEKAEILLLNLQQTNNCNRSKRGISRFRCQSIPGLDKKVTLKIHEGIEINNDYSSGFNTFYSEKYKSARIANIKPDEKLGIIVYIINNSRFKGSDVIDSPHENETAVKYLEELLNAEIPPNS